jgi:hypothetical protein
VSATTTDSFVGGSLCKIIASGDTIIKHYSGPIARGKEKLIREYEWFQSVAPDVVTQYPSLFPKVIAFISDTEHGETQLHLSRIPRNTLSKSILNGTLTNSQLNIAINEALKLLINVVYRMRKDRVSPQKGYRFFHAERISLARKYLRRLPYMQPILDASEIIVNGITCPSINQFLVWLDAKNGEIFTSENLLAFHGNFHLDNILHTPSTLVPNDQSISFIDPRGELLGFSHYDYSKILITLEAYYDEIHYDKYSIIGKARGNAYELALAVDCSCNDAYLTGLRCLAGYLETFADVENIATSKFLKAVYVSECIHILSFSFYHAYNPGANPNRIRAYMAIWALLCRRLFAYIDNGSEAIATGRLSLF